MPDRFLSENFKLSELVGSATARSRGIANDPTPEVEVNLTRLASEVLQPIRKIVGPLKINSGYRSKELNQAVGGSQNSAHCHGLAADLNPVQGTWKDLMDRIIRSGIKLDQIIYERTWVHVGLLHPSSKTQRGERLSMFVVDGKTTYEPYDPNDPRFA